MAIKILKLKELTRFSLKKEIQNEEDLIEVLKNWWVKRFNLPDNHPLFLDKTLEELVIDYYKDRFLNNPAELTAQTAEEVEEEDKKMKEEYGDDFEEAHFIPPSTAEKEGNIKEEIKPEEFEEKFTEE